VTGESLEAPDKVRELQIKLYRKAKSEPDFRFYQLYDKVYREDVLLRAWVLAKANDGAPGVEGESFGDIESKGVMEWLDGLGKELHDKTYEPQPVRRVMIPKPGGGQRPLGIPTIRDRVAQTAAKLTRISHTRSVGPEKNRMAGAFAEFSSFEENILNGLAKRRGPADPFGGLPGDSSAARAHCSEPGVPSGIT